MLTNSRSLKSDLSLNSASNPIYKNYIKKEKKNILKITQMKS